MESNEKQPDMKGVRQQLPKAPKGREKQLEPMGEGRYRIHVGKRPQNKK